MTLINMVGATVIGARPASLMVVRPLCVFAVFIVVTISDVNCSLLAFSGYHRSENRREHRVDEQYVRNQ